MSAPEVRVTTAAIDVLYDYLWEPDDAASREECAEVIVEILKASNVVSADDLRALIEQWRERADDMELTGRGAQQWAAHCVGTLASELEWAIGGGE